MVTITRAISIRQPYVELILRGEKRKEFRSRRTHIKERVYLYASMRLGDHARSLHAVGDDLPKLPKGKIVGSVEIYDCIPTKDGWAYLLRKPKRIRPYLTPKNQAQTCFWRPKF